jgi:hypothetical protein
MTPFEEPFAGVGGSISTIKLKRLTLKQRLNKIRKACSKRERNFHKHEVTDYYGSPVFLIFQACFARERVA